MKKIHPFLLKFFRTVGLFILVLLVIFLFLKGCYYRYDSTDFKKPPHGYPNFTMMKIAYVLGFIKIVNLQPEVPDSIEEFKNIEYKNVGEVSLKLDIYKLKKQKNPAPVLIFIHGGAWRTGKRSDYLPYLIDFAKQGYVTATVSYRLVKKAKFPAAVKDVKCAVKWIREHADEYLIDPDKIAVIGGSAGGHLSMMIGYSSDETEFNGECACDSLSSRVQAVVNLYGPSDLTTEYALSRREVTDFIEPSYDEAPEMYRKASPIFFITPDDPPTLIFQGTIDELVPVRQADMLKKKLDEVGVPGEYHRLKGWPHTMDIAEPVHRYCKYHMNAFFEKYIPIVNSY